MRRFLLPSFSPVKASASAIPTAPSVLRQKLVGKLGAQVEAGAQFDLQVHIVGRFENHDLRPTRDLLKLELAHLLVDRELPLPALQELNVLKGFGRSCPDAEALRGRCLLRLNRLEEAERVLQGAADTESPPPTAVEDLAACLRRLGNVALAKALERRAHHLRTGGWVKYDRTG